MQDKCVWSLQNRDHTIVNDRKRYVFAFGYACPAVPCAVLGKRDVHPVLRCGKQCYEHNRTTNTGSCVKPFTALKKSSVLLNKYWNTEYKVLQYCLTGTSVLRRKYWKGTDYAWIYFTRKTVFYWFTSRLLYSFTERLYTSSAFLLKCFTAKQIPSKKEFFRKNTQSINTMKNTAEVCLTAGGAKPPESIFVMTSGPSWILKVASCRDCSCEDVFRCRKELFFLIYFQRPPYCMDVSSCKAIPAL